MMSLMAARWLRKRERQWAMRKAKPLQPKRAGRSEQRKAALWRGERESQRALRKVKLLQVKRARRLTGLTSGILASSRHCEPHSTHIHDKWA